MPVKRALLQFMSLIGICTHTVMSCPRRCICFSTTVKCDDSSFKEVPSGIPNTTEKLTFFNNSFLHIHPNNFSNLPHLQTLELNNNKIQYIVPGSFQHTPKLKHLSLDDNHLTYLNVTTFSGLEDLTHLSLNRNPLVSVPWLTFESKKMKQLRSLEMNNNNISCSCGLVQVALNLRDRNSNGAGYRRNIDLSCWSGGKKMSTLFDTTRMFEQFCKTHVIVKSGYVQIFGVVFAIIVFCICCCGGCRETRCDCDCQCICIFCVCYNHLHTRISSFCARIRQNRTANVEVENNTSVRDSTANDEERRISVISRGPELYRLSAVTPTVESHMPIHTIFTELSDAPPTYQRVMSIVSCGEGGGGVNNPVFANDEDAEPPPSYDEVEAQASNSPENAEEFIYEERAPDGLTPVEEDAPTYDEVAAQSSIVSLPQDNDEIPPPSYDEVSKQDSVRYTSQ